MKNKNNNTKDKIRVSCMNMFCIHNSKGECNLDYIVITNLGKCAMAIDGRKNND